MSCGRRVTGDGGGGGGAAERLPNSIMIEILLKLDLQTLCSVACVSRSLRISVSQALFFFSSLDLSAFSPDSQLLNQILHRFREPKSITVDCLRLNNYSVTNFLGQNVQELKLLKGSSLSSQILASIGQACPNLRVLVLELAGNNSPEKFNSELVQLLEGCLYLESLCIKIRGTELDANGFCSIELFLPKSVKVLKLQPIFERNAIQIVKKIGDGRDFSKTSTNFGIPYCPLFPSFSLQCLSLVLDVISDELIIMIAHSLPSLAELDLEDRPTSEPMLPHDLTNNGLQFLSLCRHLTSLSLMRSRQNLPVYFKRLNNVGFFLLSEGCINLESVRLGGLSIVSDAGFTSILQSCRNLKKFEVRNAILFSDLALIDILGGPCSLVEMRLLSCSLLTSAVVEDITSNSILEVLDLSGCRSIADACLVSVSCLNTLNTLDLSGADVTDSGLAVFGKGNSPITRLCLRGCKRVTDKGVALLFNGGGTIRKTLSALDVGHIPGISDKAIQTTAEVALALSELSMRYCYYVTDASIKALASKRRFQDGSKLLRKLDLYHCLGLSVESLELLKNPSFRALQWLGVGLTRLTSKGDVGLAEICRGRPCLTLCREGCEVGCHDGWQFHYSTKG